VLQDAISLLEASGELDALIVALGDLSWFYRERGHTIWR
jgi:hypothetical protein